MNRAIATLNRLIAEENKQTLKEINRHGRDKSFSLMNRAIIKIKVPIHWRQQLQRLADKETDGNLSAYMRQIIYEDLKRTKK